MPRIKYAFMPLILLLAAGCASTQTSSDKTMPELNFEVTESELIQEGNAAATRGDWDTAVSCWKQDLTSEEPTDQAAAMYNLGLYAETKGRLTEALDNYKQVKELTGESKYDKDLARVQARMEQGTKAPDAAAAPVTTAAASASAADSAAAPNAEDGWVAWKANPGLKVEKEKGIHKFNWDTVPNAAGYHLYTAKVKEKTFKQRNKKVLAKAQLRTPSLPKGKIKVQVAALDEAGRELARSQPITMVMP